VLAPCVDSYEERMIQAHLSEDFCAAFDQHGFLRPVPVKPFFPKQ
jgi:hypothetical protein